MNKKYGSSLQRLGLSPTETKVFLYLCAEGRSNASTIAAGAGIIRPNVYDTLKSLLKKGIITKSSNNKEIMYSTISSSKLVEFSKVMESNYLEAINKVQNLAEELKKFQLSQKEPIVQTYIGFKGARLVLFESLEETKKAKQEILGIGIRNINFFLQDPIYYERYIKQREKISAKSRYLVNKNEKIYVHKNTKTRVLEKIEKDPIALYIYGDKVALWFWFREPFILVIDSKELSRTYRKYFDYLWNQSERYKK